MYLIIWFLAGVGLPFLLLAYTLYQQQMAFVPVTGGRFAQPALLNQRYLPNLASRTGLKVDLIWIILFSIVSIAVYSVLGFNDYFSKDFSYLVMPVIVPLQILIAGRLANIFMPVSLNKYSRLINIAVIGTAIVIFVSLLFNRSPQITDICVYYLGGSSPSKIQTISNIINEIADTRLYILLLTCIFITYNLLPFVNYRKSKLKIINNIVLSICIVLIGYIFFRTLNSFVFIWEPVAGISWIIFTGMIAVAFSVLAGYFTRIEDAFISEISLWFSASKIRMFIIGSLLCAYVVFMRPFLYSKAEWSAPVSDWGLTCFIIWRMYNGIQGAISDKYTVQFKYSSWKKHMQQLKVDKPKDRDLSYAAEIQNDFVEYNQKDLLLVYLVSLLHDIGVSVDETGELLHSLIEYKQPQVPVLSSQKKRNHIRTKERDRRKQILNEIMTGLEEKRLTEKTVSQE